MEECKKGGKKGREEEKEKRRKERKRRGNMKEDVKNQAKDEKFKKENTPRTENRTGISIDDLCQTN